MIAIMNMNVIRTTLLYCGCCPPVLGIRFLLSFLYFIGIMFFPLSVDVAVAHRFIGPQTGAVNDGHMVSVFPVIIIP